METRGRRAQSSSCFGLSPPCCESALFPQNSTIDTATVVQCTVLGCSFYNQSVHSLAKSLLGKILVRQMDDGTLLKGRIVETEAYPGSTDPASHTFRGKTERNAAMFDKPGTAYVYFIYGMYHCLNISAVEPGAGVLIRALQPISGLDSIRVLRKGGASMRPTDLCNGPGRLCQAFAITTSVFNKHDLPAGQTLWLESDPEPLEFVTVETSRIGINPKSFGEESVRQPWRYYILGCPDVSKRDKMSEAIHGVQAAEKSTVKAASGQFGRVRKSCQYVSLKPKALS